MTDDGGRSSRVLGSFFFPLSIETIKVPGRLQMMNHLFVKQLELQWRGE